MAEQNDEALFREIDEELRHDKAKDLWTVYGKYFIAVAVVLLLGVAGFQTWKSYDINSRTALGEQYAAAETLSLGKDKTAALDALKNLTESGNSGYALLARFRMAGLIAETGDTQGAINAYDAIAMDQNVSTTYGDLAVILSASHKLNIPSDGLAPNKRLLEIAAAKNPWHFSAREILATEDFRAGKISAARTKFKSLADNASTPSGIRERAKEILNVLGEK